MPSKTQISSSSVQKRLGLYHPKPAPDDCALSSLARDAISHRQVSRRLRELLPHRLDSLIREHRVFTSTLARADRLAHMDARYRDFVEEAVDLSYKALLAKLLWEKEVMLGGCELSQRTSQNTAKRVYVHERH